jgi:hypothetical protein
MDFDRGDDPKGLSARLGRMALDCKGRVGRVA